MNSIQEFVDALNIKFGNTFSLDERGRKFTRIVYEYGCNRSVYCFVDIDLNVFKAASWKAPAKGIRANLKTLDMGKVDGFGSWLYR